MRYGRSAVPLDVCGDCQNLIIVTLCACLAFRYTLVALALLPGSVLSAEPERPGIFVLDCNHGNRNLAPRSGVNTEIQTNE